MKLGICAPLALSLLVFGCTRKAELQSVLLVTRGFGTHQEAETFNEELELLLIEEGFDTAPPTREAIGSPPPDGKTAATSGTWWLNEQQVFVKVVRFHKYDTMIQVLGREKEPAITRRLDAFLQYSKQEGRRKRGNND